MKKISVIIPCYNSERTIKRTLDSLLSQTYKNLEVICVNDGSRDRTLEILKQYATIYSNFVVVDKKNEGVSAARNDGLKVATGELIMFLDSDDNYHNTNVIERMANTMEEENVDMVVVGFTHPTFQMFLPSGLYDLTDKTQADAFYDDFFTFGMVWNKLFKKENLTSPYNTKLGFTEDELFIVSNFTNFKSAYVINEPLYNYYAAPLDSNPPSTINSIYKNVDFASVKTGFWYMRFGGEEERDREYKKSFSLDWKIKKYKRFYDFFLYDYYFMQYVDVKKEDRITFFSNMTKEPEFRKMLEILQTENKKLKIHTDEDYVSAITKYISDAFGNKELNNSQDWYYNKIAKLGEIFDKCFYEYRL